MDKFSIIICAYNPIALNFIRLLKALERIQAYSPELLLEVLFIDNNSCPALFDQSYFREFSSRFPNGKYIIEKKAGLTSARMAGISASDGNWLVFFDDDNEPYYDYLVTLKAAISQYPNVGVWGPGLINVEFVDQSNHPWITKYKVQFQERNYTEVIYSKNKQWQQFYPVGTGLCVRNDIAKEYLKNVKSGIYSLSDRKGQILSSGGDVQMVLTGVQMNFDAGLHPGIKLNHLIAPSKTKFSYLLKHAFGTASSNLPAHNEIFPVKTNTIIYPSGRDIFLKLYYQIKVVGTKKGFREALIGLSHYLGQVKGVYQINPVEKPPLIYKILVLLLNLE